ncbi:MAG: transporter substrate-binding domain-containing protein [Paludibacterium sp.]|uniref:substrate-binding periplasmic protein n=1 Tax=Paludibacterium sp. TaxID=1917523 RepID=UPI0025DDE390|nr:transporter substrate-binding domain-containing protein [Paludibacterium sp.]MBV8048704.1 transporter substrate-binding domain-containing protein [Paludibacterium sp.]
MRRGPHKLALALCGLLSSLALAQAPKVVITYATNPNYPPYDWAISDTAYDGASIELLTRACPPGVELHPLVFPWKRAMALAEAGKIDMLISLRITPERSQFLQFTSHRAFPNPIAVFVRKDRAFPFRQWSDLRGHLGGYSAGDSFGAGFDAYWRRSLTMEEAPSMSTNFQKLLLGHIDYFVSSYYLGLGYIRSHPEAQAIIALQPMISEQDIYFAFSKQSPNQRYLDAFSQRLEALDKKGVPDALLKKYLLRYVSNPTAKLP